MTVEEKLVILADSAKYDVACTSSGVNRAGAAGQMGSTMAAGCCHSFTPDGRCVSLLKVLMTNVCCFDCAYCTNRKSNDRPRAAFTPEELADLTLQFYRRNYIEGLFLSSAVLVSPDYTMELMIGTLRLLREKHHFRGYIHAKTIPGADPMLVRQLGLLADRLSVNIEMPSERSLHLLAPDKAKQAILGPMRQIAAGAQQSRQELAVYRSAPKFAPAGQSTQMIVGASPESDYQILRLTQGLYDKFGLKRVFYSAYIPVVADKRLPDMETPVPLLREHRLYQADWLLRFYQFRAEEILEENQPNFNPYMDPKCNWAVQHFGLFPVDVERADFAMLLRVPGIGPKSARAIRMARRQGRLDMAALKRLGVVLKRAQYFICCRDWTGAQSATREQVVRALIDPGAFGFGARQLSMFDSQLPTLETAAPQVQQLALTMPPGQAAMTVREEAVQCLAQAM